MAMQYQIFYMFISKDSTSWINKCFNIKFAYHITNIYFTTIKILINLYYLLCGFINEKKIKFGKILTINDVSKNCKSKKIPKCDLGYKKKAILRHL